ncbi:MAG TPA: phosphatase PAP2 family protein [Gemmatimonadaceae bacterium]|nr:phosphatase PAP2 family protein [Gemmatimonadaceae bacterium]
MADGLARWSGVLALVLVSSVSAAAQDSPRSQPTFTRGDAWIATGFAAATAVAFGLDGRAAAWMQRPARQNNGTLKTTADVFGGLAVPGAPLLAAGAYVVGLARHDSTWTDVGLHAGEAMVAAGVVSVVIKGLAGRARPRVSLGRPHDLAFGRGFRQGDDYQSLPSLHAVAAFALAGALTAESGRRWPEHQMLIGILTYGGATLSGVSRMYRNAHWASDVLLGAGLGTLSGRMVVRWQHGHPDNWVDRTFQHLSVAPAPDGATALVYSAAW